MKQQKKNYYEKGKKTPVTVKVQSGNPELLKDIHLYLFDKDGQLIESLPLQNGEAMFKTEADKNRRQNTNVYRAGFVRRTAGEKISPMMMKKTGGYQPSVRCMLIL